MPRISMREEDIVPIPTNVTVNAKGYVYYNSVTYWVKGTDKHKGYPDHKKVCIGKVVTSKETWEEDRRMFPNKNYFKHFETDRMPEAPKLADSVSVGVLSAVKNLSTDSQLIDILVDVFGSEDTALILDLAMYMLVQESAVFQHFPHWCRNHAIFSSVIRSDSFISEFEKEKLSVSKINQFKSKWAAHIIGDGKLYFCYDSTNVNSQAEGVFLVEKGYAKDDPTLCQVNMDYVVRQGDGLPVTFTTFPGSINDMAEASEMLRFFKDLLDGTDKQDTRPDITMICDRGYISEENVNTLDDAGMQFLLMLRANMGITDELLFEYASKIKSSANYLYEYEQYAMTVAKKLFDDDTEERFFHIIWDDTLERKHRNKLYDSLTNKEKKLRKIIERKTILTKDELRTYESWFILETHEEGTVKVNKRGRGKGKKDVTGFIIDGAERDTRKIDQDLAKCGFYILVTSKEMAASEALEAYTKRDCVEKVFRALKSYLGMNKIGVHCDDSIRAKTLIWFVASILHSLIFKGTEKLRTSDRKTYTVPSIVDYLEEICADKNLSTMEYERRYKPTAKQQNIMSALKMITTDIDNEISLLLN